MVEHSWQYVMLATHGACSLPPEKTTFGCHWVYTMKIIIDSTIDNYKACLLDKGYTKIFGLDLNYVRI